MNSMRSLIERLKIESESFGSVISSHTLRSEVLIPLDLHANFGYFRLKQATILNYVIGKELQ